MDDATQRSFGATVTVQRNSRGLYLIIGRDASTATIVRSAGGDVVMRLPDGLRVLAVLSRTSVDVVRRHAAIDLVGGVTIDPGQFNRFAALVGLDRVGAPSR